MILFDNFTVKMDISFQKTNFASAFVAVILLSILPVILTSKCDSSIVTVESREILSYLGNVTFNAPVSSPHGKWTLNMTTTYPFTFIGGWDVSVISYAKKGIATFHSKEDVTVSKGDVISFRFRIHYATVRSKKIPYVKMLKWEKSTICEDHHDFKSNDFKRRIKSDHF